MYCPGWTKLTWTGAFSSSPLLSVLSLGFCLDWPQLSVSPLGDSLKEGSRTVASNRGTRRLHSGLVVVEFSLAIVVLTVAVTLVLTLFDLSSVNQGLNSAHILTARVSFQRDTISKAT